MRISSSEVGARVHVEITCLSIFVPTHTRPEKLLVSINMLPKHAP